MDQPFDQLGDAEFRFLPSQISAIYFFFQHPTLETPIDAVFLAILAKANTLQFYLGESLVHTCRLKCRPQI